MKKIKEWAIFLAVIAVLGIVIYNVPALLMFPISYLVLTGNRRQRGYY